MYYLVPPAGTPTPATDILKIIKHRLLENPEAFELELNSFLGVNSCYLLNSGRAALSLGLRALARMSSAEKNEVVIPAYTCFTVAASVVRAGLRLRLVDIDARTLDYDYEKLQRTDFTKVLAIVECNLLGIPGNWDRLKSISGPRGIYLVDDAAQALGNKTGGNVIGLSGDLGIFSLGRGKGLSTYSGGILVTVDDTIESIIKDLLKTFPRVSSTKELSALANILLYSLFLSPKLYWLPARIPFLGLGKTVFNPDFEMCFLSPIQKSAGYVLFKNIEHFNARRIQNTMLIAEKLARSGSQDRNIRYEIPGFSQTDPPAYLRLPLLCPNSQVRDKAIARLRSSGISASTMYPSTIRRIRGIEKHLVSTDDDFEGARTIVDRMLVVPTHPMLKSHDIETMVSCLKGIV
jgi:dTDP-4-amino-4,6-dideoxygalactose transaminase